MSNTREKILFVLPNLPGGGAERVFTHLGNNLNSYGNGQKIARMYSKQVKTFFGAAKIAQSFNGRIKH